MDFHVFMCQMVWLSTLLEAAVATGRYDRGAGAECGFKFRQFLESSHVSWVSLPSALGGSLVARSNSFYVPITRTQHRGWTLVETQTMYHTLNLLCLLSCRKFHAPSGHFESVILRYSLERKLETALEWLKGRGS